MNNVYKDIAERTNGNIYIGVVGPVRTGKSTFVTQLMQKLILPNIEDANDKARAIDELPQSADGKMIMTTQPKFVPDNAVKVTVGEKATANLRLVDCVGYLVDGAEGHLEGDKQRLVNTPWATEPVPFEVAAEMGTKKVATEHSTIAVVVTTDGSIGEIPRKNYISAEERVVAELKTSGKPFVIVLNCANPQAESTHGLCRTMGEKYGAQILPLNLATATAEELKKVLESLLLEFSVRRIAVNLPSWMRALPRDNRVILTITEKLKDACVNVDKMKDVNKLCENIACEYLENAQVGEMDCAKGVINCNLTPKADLFFKVLSEEAQVDITDEFSLMSYVTTSAYAKRRFEILKDALNEADVNGYGVVYPLLDQMSLDEPQMIKQGNIYGVRMQAKAPSYHIIKVDVTTDVSPMVGTEQQSQYLLDEYKTNPTKIWNTNMFGRTMSGIASDGLLSKCTTMPIEVKQKLTKTVNRIVNENKGGLLCILL